MAQSFLDRIKDCIRSGRFKFSNHCYEEAAEEDILLSEVLEAVLGGDVVEDYAKDKRGHSCLVLGYSEKGLPIHTHCGMQDDYCIMITTYVPNLSKHVWMPDLRTRIRR
jgi:hypothetical protein